MKRQGRNDDPKIETDLGDAAITVNSLAIPTTSISDRWGWKVTKDEFEAHHIFFRDDGGETYIGKMFSRIGLKS